MVHWAFDSAHRGHIRSTPFQVMMSGVLARAISVPGSAGQDGKDVDRLNEVRMRGMVKELVERQDVLHGVVLWGVSHERRRSREAFFKGELTVFFPWEFVVVARPRKANKLVTWTNPWSVVVDGKNVCTVEYLMTGQTLKVHVARMRPYAEESLDVTEELVIACIQRKGELRTVEAINSGPLDDGSQVLIAWVGLDGKPS